MTATAKAPDEAPARAVWQTVTGRKGQNNPTPMKIGPASWGVRVPCDPSRMKQGRGLISENFAKRFRWFPIAYSFMTLSAMYAQ